MNQIMLITIDTARADHLGAYGWRRATSPVLDRLAAEGTTFDWALSPCSYTGPAHYSVMTSKYPSFHGVGFRNGRVPSDDCKDTTLAQVLGSAGYATGAFVSASVLGLRNMRPMAKGFDTYDDRMTRHESNRPSELRRLAADTAEAALAWIREHRAEPFFAWVHFMDVHGPYEAPEPHGGQFIGEVLGREPWRLETVRDGEIGGIPEYQILNVIRAPAGSIIDCEHNFDYYAARYDGGIRYVDACIGDLLGGLKHLGVYGNLLLAVTSDHGEALGENGVFFFHSLTVSMDQIRVPLILRLPERLPVALGAGSSGPLEGEKQRRMPGRVATQVSTLDIAPTLLDLVGLGGLEAQGASLRPLIDGQRDVGLAERVVFSEIETQVAAVDAAEQVLLGRGVPEVKQFPFFHPAAADSETTVSYRGAPAPRAQRQRPSLEALAADFARQGREAAAQRAPTGTPGEDAEGDAEVASRLKALGYIS
jgi:arylsulfatase A-like enzyme